jgi:hypothetical protein
MLILPRLVIAVNYPEEKWHCAGMQDGREDVALPYQNASTMWLHDLIRH